MSSAPARYKSVPGATRLDGSVSDIALRAIPVLIGGGIVQFIIFLLRRRAEVRSLNSVSQKTEAEGGSFAVRSAAESLELSDRVRDRAVKRAEILEIEAAAQAAKIRDLTERLGTVESALAGVEALRAEVNALRAENASLRTEVEICRRTHP